MTRDADGASVRCDAGSERFDQVVLACHGDQALALLDDASDAEREILGAIRYQPNVATLHTDERFLPRSPRARASWNYHLDDEGATGACLQVIAGNAPARALYGGLGFSQNLYDYRDRRRD